MSWDLLNSSVATVKQRGLVKLINKEYGVINKEYKKQL